MACEGCLATIRPAGACCAYFCLFLNIFLPGIGTIFNQLFCCGYSGGCSLYGVFIGLLQLICSAFLVGWIWSIWWGVEIVRRSGK